MLAYADYFSMRACDRYEPTTSPKAILPDIERAINRAREMS
jgi:hypothetical protein